jgi:hypothetical protein
VPTVPRYERARVATEPLGRPAVPRPRGLVPVEPVDLSGVQQIVANLYEREAKRGEDTRALDYRARLAAARNEILYDPDRGALTRQGEAAFKLPEQVADRWRRTVSDVEREMGGVSRSQRLTFDAIAENYFLELDGRVQSHVASQREQFETEKLQNLVDDESAFGLKNFADPNIRDLALAKIRGAYSAYGQAFGKPKEWIQHQTAIRVSSFHASVITRMEANGLDPKPYLEENRDELIGDNLLRAEQTAQEFTLMAKGQQLADEIIGRPGVTRREAFERAREIEDPRIRQEVEQRLDTEFSRRDQANREEQNKALELAYGLVDKGRPVPATISSLLSPSNRRAIATRQRQLAGGGNPETNWETYYGLRAMAAVPGESRTEFLGTNLLEYRTQLDDSEFKEMVNLQIGLSQGDESDENVRGILSEEAVVAGEIEKSGMFTGTAAAAKKRLTNFRQLVNRRVISEKRSAGVKTLDPDRLTAIVREMLRRAASSPWILEGDGPPAAPRPR